MEKLFIFLILLFVAYKIYTSYVKEYYDDFNSKPMAEYKSNKQMINESESESKSKSKSEIEDQIIYDDLYSDLSYYNPYYISYFNPYSLDYNSYYYDNYNQKTFNKGYRWSTKKSHRNIHLKKHHK